MTGAPKTVHMYPPPPEFDNDDIDLAELLGTLIENRWLIVAITLLTLAAGGYKSFTEAPMYEVDNLLQVEKDDTSPLGNLDAASIFDEHTSVNAEIQILYSRSVLGEVVDKLKLDIKAQPELSALGAALARRRAEHERPLIRVDTLDLPDSMRSKGMKLVAADSQRYELYDDSNELLLRGAVGEAASLEIGGGETLRLFVSVLQGEPGQTFRVHKIPRISAIQSLQGRLKVEERDPPSGILAVSLTGADPQSIQRQVNEIAKVYVQQNVERRSAEAQQTLDFLDQQLPIVRDNMESAELALNDYRIEQGSIDLPLETQTVLQGIVAIEAQLNTLRQEREKIRQAFTEVHPTALVLNRQIGRLDAQLARLNDQVQNLPGTQQELLRLLRDVEVNTALYRSLLDTAQQLRVVKAGTIGNVRVIDYAVLPNHPGGPNRTRIMLLALLLGVISGVAAAFARQALKSGVEDADLVEKQVNVPVYATILHSRRQDRLVKSLKAGKAERAILAVDQADDPAIESLRNLQTALHFGMINVKNNCVMIAGPGPGVGKSFVSINLAAVLAGNGKKVLLIDGDLRRGHLHQYLCMERERGLSEFIRGDLPIDKVLHPTSVPGLTLIPTGALPPNPAELLLHQNFSDCLNVLTPRYEHIIIDSPPILAVTDATIIGQMAGGVLLVLKSGAHPMREIELSIKRLQQAEVNLRGILFNDIRVKTRNYGAGRYNYYNYQYSYKRD